MSNGIEDPTSVPRDVPPHESDRPRPNSDPLAGASTVYSPPTGRVSWALGLISFIATPIPFLPAVTGLLMTIPLRRQRTLAPVAAANARNAANWGLTYAVLTVALVGAALLVVGIGTDFRGGTLAGGLEAVALTLLGVAVLGLGIAQAIASIGGTIVASRGRVFRMPIAIPFVRRRPTDADAVAEAAGASGAPHLPPSDVRSRVLAADPTASRLLKPTEPPAPRSRADELDADAIEPGAAAERASDASEGSRGLGPTG